MTSGAIAAPIQLTIFVAVPGRFFFSIKRSINRTFAIIYIFFLPHLSYRRKFAVTRSSLEHVRATQNHVPSIMRTHVHRHVYHRLANASRRFFLIARIECVEAIIGGRASEAKRARRSAATQKIRACIFNESRRRACAGMRTRRVAFHARDVNNKRARVTPLSFPFSPRDRVARVWESFGRIISVATRARGCHLRFQKAVDFVN